MHGYANPARFLRLAKWLTPLLLVSGLVLTAGALGWGYLNSPEDRLMGDTVKILYVHVPAAWLGMGGWSALAIACLAELVWRHPLSAISARAIAVPGAVFTFVCLATGSIWGAAYMGLLVGVGWPFDQHVGAAFPLFCLYCSVWRFGA